MKTAEKGPSGRISMMYAYEMQLKLLAEREKHLLRFMV